jgi:hypothetical protein
LSCFGDLIIKKILKYQLLNVYGSVEIQMFILSKNNTISSCSSFDVVMKIAYTVIISRQDSIEVLRRSGSAHDFLTKGSWFESQSAHIFFLFVLLFILIFNIKIFFYTIMYICINLLENVNKSCTSAGSFSLIIQ